MNQFPLFIQKAFLSRLQRKPIITSKQNPTTVEYSLADQVARYIPLLELQDRRQLLEVEVVGSCHLQSYQSMIVGLDFVKQLLLLDGLTPINPYNPVIPGDKLIVTHKQQGQVLSFVGELDDIISDGGHLIYAITLPVDFAYQHRRFYPRLILSGDLKNKAPMTVKLKSPLKTPWPCTIQNISAGGMRISVAGKISQQLTIGMSLPMAEIIFNEWKLSCPLTVKSFRQTRKPYERTEMSLSFNNIAPQDRVRLQSYIGFYLQPDTSTANLVC